MEPGAQVPDWASEDEGLPPVPPPLGAAPKHSTPRGHALRRRRRPAGRVAYRTGAGLASASPPPTIPARPLSPPRRERRLSAVWDSEEASGRLGPDSDPRVPEEEPPGPASVPRRWQQQQEVSPGSGRRGKGLPGIPNSARPRRRDLKMLAAVVERVRQWEARQLQNIEEATWHELTVEDDPPDTVPWTAMAD
uniref:Coiled-coil domain containing 201 n=1 Tax=Rousettus aegyptiacus TaxID=9407 RepID=A0A7J8D6X6_ROUAE|nr:hypothetical protein HJG63_008808 [Rousettus aegyptiacus]